MQQRGLLPPESQVVAVALGYANKPRGGEAHAEVAADERQHGPQSVGRVAEVRVPRCAVDQFHDLGHERTAGAGVAEHGQSDRLSEGLLGGLDLLLGLRVHGAQQQANRLVRRAAEGIRDAGLQGERDARRWLRDGPPPPLQFTIAARHRHADANLVLDVTPRHAARVLLQRQACQDKRRDDQAWHDRYGSALLSHMAPQAMLLHFNPEVRLAVGTDHDE